MREQRQHRRPGPVTRGRVHQRLPPAPGNCRGRPKSLHSPRFRRFALCASAPVGLKWPAHSRRNGPSGPDRGVLRYTPHRSVSFGGCDEGRGSFDRRNGVAWHGRYRGARRANGSAGADGAGAAARVSQGVERRGARPLRLRRRVRRPRRLGHGASAATATRWSSARRTRAATRAASTATRTTTRCTAPARRTCSSATAPPGRSRPTSRRRTRR